MEIIQKSQRLGGVRFNDRLNHEHRVHIANKETIMSKIQLFGFEGSTYLRSATMACAESGLEWEILPLEFGKPSHLSLHPFGKMPVMKHGAVTLYETAAILSYLDDLSGGETLIPDTAIDRARMWQLVSICIDYAYRSLVTASFVDDKDAVDPEPAARCLDAVQATMGSGPYLTGARLSIADLVFEPMLSHYLASMPAAGEQMHRRPRLARWRDSIQARPATRAAYRESQSA